MTTDTREIQKSMRDYCASKLNNLKDMAKFPETYTLLRLNHEEIWKI